MPNRLINEASPYLRQHADNPVDWHPWDDEALEQARAQNKPILLSVGYSACHWCHVMAHESFENPQIAKLMNDSFINIKVDREERPDLDQLYQGVVQLMGRGGGWPLTVFLTPDLRPFYGGTYFPPDDKFGMPGFPKILSALAEAWSARAKEVDQQAKQFAQGLGQLSTYGLDSPPNEVTAEDVIAAGVKLEDHVDSTFGGFGSAPKFPNPMSLSLLLRAHRRSGKVSLLHAVKLTLEKMAYGGIYDQLGGGFHRYSVDQRWLVPHFEKMLYDNAQLIHLYAEAYQVAPESLWKKVVEETVEYVRHEMTSHAGGFYATQDADSEGEEGKFFVWTPEQVDAALPPELSELAKACFNITKEGNFEHHQTVLEVRRQAKQLAAQFNLTQPEVRERLAQARSLLFQAREKRVKPGRDEKILAGWNGLMIRGLSFAARVFNRPDWVEMARRAADFALSHLWRDDRLWRTYQNGTSRIAGFIEDYGDLAAGLVALYQACFEVRYLEAAEALTQRAVDLFWDPEKQAYRTAPRGQKDLFTVPFALHDNAFPSGASTLCEAQINLAALLGKSDLLEQAGKYVRKMRDEMMENPFAFGHLMLAADSWLDGATEVTLAGEREQLAPFEAVVRSTFAPTLSVNIRPPQSDVPRVLREVMSGKEPVGGKAAAYLCRNFSCLPPILEPAELKSKLTTLSSPSGRGSG